VTRLLDLCSLIRSKNAGPFWLTFAYGGQQHAPLIDLAVPAPA
jgi:hypothetical protein